MLPAPPWIMRRGVVGGEGGDMLGVGGWGWRGGGRVGVRGNGESELVRE